ncbi:hypothetical protein AMATHDRAFT_198392 [Amanita thiersii Skay4041]|uniref:Glutamate--tRNA ligase, mitochondrial n=1 Tax=Amanita thiersii Skay4041 TaxID=703135 RepID=A0A2A9N8R1_9AGAR|nr:hypothetical protein AMATHDRAFT_198392 [Amanita thiersii Skay4041]
MTLLRFAPSPTGSLHLGGLRMALYNHLYSRKNNGKWILRIEDTDATRYVPGAVQEIQAVLLWAGLDYDFGPGKNGPHGPYFQSKRLDLYQDYAKKLLESGHAYRCFCSLDTLTETREKLARTGSNLTYDKRCLHLTDEEVARRVKAGEKSVIRLNDGTLPDRSTVRDLVFGEIRDAHLSLGTDPILLKSDLYPTYHLASVVDDHEMGITHVLRGEEWIPSLPLHLDLYASLKLQPPRFAHIPILLNPDGSKMSKRTGDVSVVEYIRNGWEPEALLNWLALTGWGARHQPMSPFSSSTAQRQVQAAPDSTSILPLPSLISQFDLTALTHRSSSLDQQKLRYLNRQHIALKAATPEGLHQLAMRVHGLVKEVFPHSLYASVENTKKAVVALEGRLENMAFLPVLVPYLFEDPNLASPEARSMLSSRKITEEQREPLNDMSQPETNPKSKQDQPREWVPETLYHVLHEEQKRLGVQLKMFMLTLRHALTGMKDGPGIVQIMCVLGKERTMKRLR